MEYLGNHDFKYLKCIYDDAFIIPAIPTNHIRKLMTYTIIEQLFELDEFVESISEL